MRSSCNIARPEFIKKLEAIEPSDTGPWGQHQKHRPCKITLKDGTVIPRVICVEEHRGLTFAGWIYPDNVADMEPTVERMPAELATKLYEAGESGMGYEIFKMAMKDGSSHVFVTGNIVDFPDYPDGYDAQDVADVFPHEGRKESKHGYRQGRKFVWCYYVKE